MQDRREACTVLGLPEEAGHLEIEDRYFLLVKKYKYLAQDVQPSPGEPIFTVINEAYRFLTGYAPLQKVEYRELKWKEKIGYIREHYMMEITLIIVISLLVLAVGTGIYALDKALPAGPGNPVISSTVESPLPIAHVKADK